MKTPEELFIHELEDMYDAESQILGILPEMAKEAQNTELRQGIKHHEVETKTQIKNLEKAFKLLGHEPEKTTCMGVKGLSEEHTAMLEENPAPEVLELFNLGAAAKTEQYEICAYTDLIDMAKLLGHKDVIPLFEENLKHEEEMAKKIKTLSKTISKETIRELQPA